MLCKYSLKSAQKNKGLCFSTAAISSKSSPPSLQQRQNLPELLSFVTLLKIFHMQLVCTLPTTCFISSQSLRIVYSFNGGEWSYISSFPPPPPPPLLSYWLPGLARARPHSPLVRPKFLPWLTDSYISNSFHARGLLIALMMEAARTSETLVNFYQTTRRYNPEDSHLQVAYRLVMIEQMWTMNRTLRERKRGK
jgi:hypothetical protein